MPERLANEKQPDLIEVKFNISNISVEDHDYIQNAINNLYIELEDSTEPLHSGTKVMFVPLNETSSTINPDSDKVATIVDLDVSSHKSDYAESSRSTHNISSSFKSYHSEHRRYTLLEQMSVKNVNNEDTASNTILEVTNHHLELQSTVTLEQLAQSLAKLAGIQDTKELGVGVKDTFSVNLIRNFIEKLTAENNPSNYALGEITKYRVYGNREFDMGGKVIDYDSDRKASLQVIESKNPSAKSIGLTAVALVELYGKGLITQQLDYRYFSGHTDKPTAVMTLSSRDFSRRELRKLAINNNYDIIKSTLSSIKLLQDIPGFKN